MSKYNQIEDGGILELPEEGDTLYLACCDCGLVHEHVWAENIETGERVLVVFRDERRTAQLRRHHYGDLHNSTGKWRLIRNDT